MAQKISMKIMSWNCRGLRGPSRVSQLKEYIRLNLPDLVFVCESKQNMGFVATVCERLKFEKRWEVQNLQGRKGGLLVFGTIMLQLNRLRNLTFVWNF